MDRSDEERARYAPMIVEIPDAEDFARASINLLNLAWQIAIESLSAYENSEVIHPHDLPVQRIEQGDGRVLEFGGPDTTFTPAERRAAEAEYWRRSQPALGNALSLIQQAIEMGFKGRIAAVSPFLLIARDARDYPSGSAHRDVPFSEFRSLDAADLMRVHNTVRQDRLSPEFGERWDEIRRQRNVLIHSVVKTSDLLHPVQLVSDILTVAEVLHSGQPWFRHRLDFALNDEIEAAYAPDPPQRYGSVLSEFDTVIRWLLPKLVRQHFGIEPRARSYLCMHCRDDCDGDIWVSVDPGRHAQLSPRSSTASAVKCGVCGRVTAVSREPCGYPECKSNVLSADEGSFGICLVCEEGRPEAD